MRVSNSITEITAGKLRDQITVSFPVYTKDDQSGTVVTYQTPATIYAYVQTLRDTRSLDNAGVSYTDPKEIWIRWMILTKDCRIEYNGVNYTIHDAFDANNKKQYLKITCYGKGVQS